MGQNNKSSYHTHKLSLPLIAPAQASKHITHNEALSSLDALIQISVLDMDVSDPPQAPELGASYHLSETPTGEWSEYAGKIASFSEGGWSFHHPMKGWIVYDETDQNVKIFKGSHWEALIDANNSIQLMPSILGVNTQADNINRFSVKSDAVFLSHDDLTPGSGDMRLIINKASPTDTVSFVMQSGYSGRAEVGLTGQDNFSLKVSPDGIVWTEAFVVDAVTGVVSLPQTPNLSGSFNLFPDGGRFSGTPEAGPITAASFVHPSYFQERNGTSFSLGPSYVSNSQTYGGSKNSLDPEITALLDKIRSDSFAKRFGVEFHSLNLVVGNGTSGATTIEGETFVRAVQNDAVSLPSLLTLTLNIRVKTGAVVFFLSSQSDLYIDGVLTTETTPLRPSDSWVQVTRLVRTDPNFEVGYDTGLFRMNSTPGCECLIALPSARIGLYPPVNGQLTDYVMSSNAWG